MKKLNAVTARTLTKNAIELPRYDTKALTSGIVHIGFGAFHRGHQALYTHEAMNAFQDCTWGITAASLFSQQGAIKTLPEQDYLYSVLELNPNGDNKLKLCSAIQRCLAVSDNRMPLIEAMAAPSTRIVSLTITEKGYCLSSVNGKLLLDNVLIQHDLNNPSHPKSAIGLIVTALSIRRSQHISPFTVMSCDNCPENGQRTRSAVLQFAKHISSDLAAWIHDHVAFPSTMVDRIIPAQTKREFHLISQHLNLEDHCGIACESFRQWVIEDNFPLGRPAWESIKSVTFVKDILPYENMKLRMLNGAHSFLAYLGFLAGYSTIFEAMSNPDFTEAIKKLLHDEVIPVLSSPEGINTHDYADALILRFKNSHIEHLTSQIAIDGSQKIPQRWLHTVKQLLLQDLPFNTLALGIAGWMLYASGSDKDGGVIDVNDPMVETFKNIDNTYNKDPDKTVKAFLALDAIFDPDIANQSRFFDTVVKAYRQLVQQGARRSVKLLQQQQ